MSFGAAVATAKGMPMAVIDESPRERSQWQGIVGQAKSMGVKAIYCLSACLTVRQPQKAADVAANVHSITLAGN
jgi:hypothetical protein